jgi:hypothetical protein
MNERCLIDVLLSWIARFASVEIGSPADARHRTTMLSRESGAASHD